ncbi:N-acetyltransferase GCN5 [Hoyosella rhizosphaerae]|uniref:N-acetyltransferase GCN5 n=1 Tax=Hoyosella rhizosphaerae TaxID=1755582 RepID=A0A916UDA5_9ACTN|nr:N-acetyltransferase GCN5 [Hoyosella rhizosphaerae]
MGPLTTGAGIVVLRPIKLRDAPSWSRLRRDDEDYLRPWEPSGEGGWLSRHGPTSWFSVYGNLRSAAHKGLMMPFAIELNGQFCGQITVGNIVRGQLSSGWIGYWVAREVSGRGVATAALALGVDHAFSAGKLHRLEATVRPANLASQSVLRNVGFREEGLLRRYLHVDGDWRDHKLVALLADEFPDSAVARLVRSGRATW